MDNASPKSNKNKDRIVGTGILIAGLLAVGLGTASASNNSEPLPDPTQSIQRVYEGTIEHSGGAGDISPESSFTLSGGVGDLP